MVALPHRALLVHHFPPGALDDLRAVIGGPAQTAGSWIGALGFTTSERISFRSYPDVRTAAHEVTHALQQRRGRLTGVLTSSSGALELEADTVAEQVAAGSAARPIPPGAVPVRGAHPASIQLRTDQRSYATAAYERGPVWDVELIVLDAPPQETEDYQDFVYAAMDGITDATYALGSGAEAKSRGITVTGRYRAGRDYTAVREDFRARALQSVLPARAAVPAAKTGATQRGPRATTGTKAAAVAGTATDARTASQRLRLLTLRDIDKALGGAFAVIDAALPDTRAYVAFRSVRDTFLSELAVQLDAAEVALAQPGTSDAAQLQLERAQVVSFLLPIYASLAALIRAAETDRLVPNAIVLLTAEAVRYQDVLAKLLHPQLDRALLGKIREMAPTWVAKTHALVDELNVSLARGREWLRTWEAVRKILDIPIQFLSGVELPPQVLLATFAVEKGAFAIAHKEQLARLKESAPPFLGELAWLEGNAPATRRYVLDPVFAAVGKEALLSFEPGDIAFILGRTVRNIVAAGGTITWRLAIKSLAKATLIVTLLDSPKLISHGLGTLAARTKESALAAIGGATDPHGIVADLNRQLESHLTPEEAAELLAELTQPNVVPHLRTLTAAGAVVGPNMAAVVADLEGSGALTAGTATAARAMEVPLLPPAP